MKNKKYISGATIAVAMASLLTAVPAFADTTTVPPVAQINGGWGNVMHKITPGMGMGGMNHGRMMKLDVFGTVTAINGNTITVSQPARPIFNKDKTTTPPAPAASTIYTVDATNAKVMTGGVASTVSAIVVGDMISVQGTVTGTNVIATTINDGKVGMVRGEKGDKEAMQNPIFTGNGQPVVAGKISAINGTTISITNSSNITYTIDTTNAKFVQGQTAIALSNLAVGNEIVVQGVVNGNAVVATTVIDQTMPAKTTTGTPANHPGVIGSIGQFFKHLFGF